MINKVMLIGNLGADPEMRYTASGTAVATFRLATSERFKDQSGEWQDRTEWHRVVAFGRLAEICGEYLTKGRQIYIEGRIQTRTWEDQQGQTRYTTEIVAREMKMLGQRGDGGGGRPSRPQNRPQQQQRSSAPPPAGPPDDFEDDIPF